MPKQYRLKGTSLDAIRDRAEQQYGPLARIVAAEKVTNPGIAGLFAANRFEATVEVPDVTEAAEERPTAAAHPGGTAHALQGPAIAALLEQADAAELVLHRPAAAPVSTASPDFAGLLEQLGKEFQATAPAEPQRPAPLPAGPASGVGHPVPVPLTGDGNLIILLGLGGDALGPALEMSIAAGGSDVRTAGELTAFGHLHVEGRQGATAARAQAVLTGQTVLVAFGLGRPREAAAHAALIAGLAPDQLWVVADAGRKPEDSIAWVQALSKGLGAASLRIDALAVFGTEDTSSPETVNRLGIPVGWVDGKPARAATIGKVD